MTKENVKSAIQDVKVGNSADAKEKINAALYAKVADALQTKKMEISNDWLNSLTAEADEEETRRNT